MPISAVLSRQPQITMALRIFWLALGFMTLSCGFAAAQETQFLPEMDVYYKLTENVRLWARRRIQETVGNLLSSR